MNWAYGVVWIAQLASDQQARVQIPLGPLFFGVFINIVFVKKVYGR